MLYDQTTSNKERTNSQDISEETRHKDNNSRRETTLNIVYHHIIENYDYEITYENAQIYFNLVLKSTNIFKSIIPFISLSLKFNLILFCSTYYTITKVIG